MNYNPEHSYRIAYGAMVLVLAPFFFIFEYTYKGSILLFPALIIGMEYSYTFPRQAMKLYEEILFQSLLERFHVAIQILMLVSLGVTEVYLSKTNNILQFFLFLFVYLLWYSFFQKQSLLVGSKSIAIGRTFFSYDSISSLSLKGEGLVIEVKGKSFTIYNWALGKNRDGLETIAKEIAEVVRS